MKERKWGQYILWGLTAFLVILASVGVIFLLMNATALFGVLHKITVILMPIIYGAIMAYLMAPVYNRVYAFLSFKLKDKFKHDTAGAHLAKAAATIVAVFLLCAIAIGLISMMIPQLYRSILSAINSAPASINAFYNWLNQTLSGDYAYKEEVLGLYQGVINMWNDFVNNTLKPNIDVIVGQVYYSLRSVLMLVYNLVIGLIVMIYLLNIKDKLLPQLRKVVFALLPKEWAARTIEELHYVNQVFGGFIIGKIVDSLIIGILCFAVLSVMHMPYTLLVSVIVGVTNIIPFFGPFIGAIPSTILILTVSPMDALYFVIFVLLLQQFDGNILGPKILGDRTGISSFWVLFSILLFGGLFGFVGMIIAVPTWAVLLHFVKIFTEKRLREKGLPLASRAYSSSAENGFVPEAVRQAELADVSAEQKKDKME